MFPEQISVSIRFYDSSAGDPATTKGKQREQYIVRSKTCCQGPSLLFIPLACNGSLLFLTSGLGSVCILGLQLLGSVADNFGVVVVFGTAGLLVELLLRFFIVFLTFSLALTLLFGFFLFVGRDGLCFLRGRSFVWREDAVSAVWTPPVCGERGGDIVPSAGASSSSSCSSSSS